MDLATLDMRNWSELFKGYRYPSKLHFKIRGSPLGREINSRWVLVLRKRGGSFSSEIERCFMLDKIVKRCANLWMFWYLFIHSPSLFLEHRNKTEIPRCSRAVVWIVQQFYNSQDRELTRKAVVSNHHPPSWDSRHCAFLVLCNK